MDFFNFDSTHRDFCGWVGLELDLGCLKRINNQLKLKVNGEVITDPKKQAEELKKFFKEKVDDLLEEIKVTQTDLLEPVR